MHRPDPIPRAELEPLDALRAGRLVRIPTPVGDLVVARASRLSRAGWATLGALIATGYTATAGTLAAVGLVAGVWMLAAPTGLGVSAWLWRARRRARDRRLLDRYRPSPGPIYGRPRGFYAGEEADPAPEPLGPVGPVREDPAPPRTSYAAAWRTQRAIESGRNLPRGTR